MFAHIAAVPYKELSIDERAQVETIFKVAAIATVRAVSHEMVCFQEASEQVVSVLSHAVRSRKHHATVSDGGRCSNCAYVLHRRTLTILTSPTFVFRCTSPKHSCAPVVHPQRAPLVLQPLIFETCGNVGSICSTFCSVRYAFTPSPLHIIHAPQLPRFSISASG